MVQRPAASSRNAPAGGTVKAVQAAPAPSRVKNAKELRSAYVDLMQSPDGVDLDPLTMPKCVECGNCGFPVYPRTSKVATKKTFERAGITRGTRKEEEAARRAEGLPEEEAGSEDSRDTVERMADEMDDLKDRIDELETETREQKDQIEDLTAKLEQTEKELAEALDKIDFMTEAEERWREKNSQARLEIERLKKCYDRASMVSADREAGYIDTLLKLRALQAKHAAFVKRRDAMLEALDNRLEQKEREDNKAIVLRLWRPVIIEDKLTGKLEDLEVKRQREVRDLGQQLHVEKEHVATLKEAKEVLISRLKEAAQRLLRRSMGLDAFPGGKAHIFRALVGMHPVNLLENQLEACQNELEVANENLFQKTEEVEVLTEEKEKLTEERDKLLESSTNLQEELDFLKEQGGSLEELERRRKERAERERQHKAELEKLRDKMKAAEEAFEEQLDGLETQIRVLESRIALMEAEQKAKKGDGEFDDVPDDEASRVAPKGQGVMCISCLKQLVHRTVRPLPPVEALSDTGAKLEKAKKKFFQQELQGVLDPNDDLHAYTFNTRKDPYGIARLTLYPGNAITKPLSPSSPTSGLPALKKRTALGSSAPSLRASMKEFKPKSFR